MNDCLQAKGAESEKDRLGCSGAYWDRLISKYSAPVPVEIHGVGIFIYRELSANK